jgi:thiol-disulfide isomerase/thioredoxin
MHPARRLASLACALTVFAVTVHAAARAAELPRYKLKVGQELVYKTTEAEYKIDYTINVLGANPDGSWRLAFRQKMDFGGGQDRTSAGYFDLAADGRLIESATLGPMGNPTILFPPLPADDAALTGTWTVTYGFDDTTRSCQVADPPAADKNLFLFTDKPRTIFDKVYVIDTTNVFTFDRAQGLVTKIKSTSSQGWPAGSAEPTVQIMELAESRELSAADTKALAEELDRYFAAKLSYDKLSREASHDFEHAKELMEKAAAELKKLEPELKVPAVQALAKAALAQHDQYLGYTLENAERFGNLLNKPSADWKTTDLDGKETSLADYRGKVVLLDFWYRGCGWCVRSMPQIKQVVDDFAGQDVVVLGMNNDDKNPDDARFVIDAMKLNYATLKNGGYESGIHARYGVQGWPTLVMLDAKGVVRHIHVGYSPTLRQELTEKIKELLAEK